MALFNRFWLIVGFLSITVEGMHQLHPFKALLNTGQVGFWRPFATFSSEGLGIAHWVDLGGGVKGEIQLFSKYCHVAYRIKGKHGSK